MILKEERGELGLAQNDEKAEHLPVYMMEGCVKETKKAMERSEEPCQGKVASRAK